MLPKLRQILQCYATLATEHAINVIENGAKTVCSVQGFVSDVNNSNYSVVSTFAQATVVSIATFAYYNSPVLIGAFTLGAILISPSDSIECVKNTVKAGLTAGYVAYETVEGLVAGTVGIVSLIADNIYGDTAELLAGTINTNMIEYYS
ncbi:hypothetical protein [Rickettsia montanensis]|uniref:Uncharacterized protein n=1 Tax=Rickettsia montanensis (strain OSU 85-930) TaxID=1105114 RepID=H8KD90_RICMS|nr:hypothetical protein [Rickettsia montanensis]AFC74081.1 hypothetical protein MCI_06440 [Rickettsia montanensis str. OSU 85-930]